MKLDARLLISLIISGITAAKSNKSLLQEDSSIMYVESQPQAASSSDRVDQVGTFSKDRLTFGAPSKDIALDCHVDHLTDHEMSIALGNVSLGNSPAMAAENVIDLNSASRLGTKTVGVSPITSPLDPSLWTGNSSGNADPSVQKGNSSWNADPSSQTGNSSDSLGSSLTVNSSGDTWSSSQTGKDVENVM